MVNAWKFPKTFYLIFIIGTTLLYFTRIIDIFGALDIAFGVAVSALIFYEILIKKFDYLKAIIIAITFNLGYSIVRFFLFRKSQIAHFAELVNRLKEFFAENVQQSTEQMMIAERTLDRMEMIFSDYYYSLWVMMMAFAIYIGALLVSKKIQITWDHKKVRLPFYFIYILILGLILLLIEDYRVLGGNIILVLVPIFLIQGSSILDFFWGKYFRKSKFLLFLLIFSVILNYYILLLIVLIGLIDIWFNIRKLNIMEE